MNKNKVKIKCNPYTKKIEYFWWNYEEEDWSEVSDSSSLSCEPFTNATIQNKIYDIICELDKNYSMGNVGLEIVFEGTDDDYKDIQSVLECNFSNRNITCKRGENHIEIASEVMPKIEEIFNGLKDLFIQYPDREALREIDKFYDAVKPTVSICVMGLYSAGKSAFVNALIGLEILPSASDPTTARNYKITAGEQAEIRFTYSGEKVILNFNGSEYHPNKTAELDILSKLQNVISSGEIHTQEVHMYGALELINKYDRENETGKIEDLIEVTVPFKNSSLPIDRYRFVIYDTPGSDSSSHKNHLEILKKSLRGQTNGLPVFITTPDDMDRVGNEDIINMINDIGGALDRTNAMVIVNKSDEKESEDLASKKRKCKELCITNKMSARVYFVSSIIGLGSKMENAIKKEMWMDKSYFKVFKKEIDSFSNSDDDFYMQLYKYNLMSQYDYGNYCKQADKDVEKLVFYNSGLHCIEKEISEFAAKHSLYNKCEKAKDYLNSAIGIIDEKIRKIEEKYDGLKINIQNSMDTKKKELIVILEGKGKELEDTFNHQYAKEISEMVVGCYDTKAENKKIDEKWEECKKLDKIIRISVMNDKVNNLMNTFLQSFGENASAKSEKFWNGKQTEFKQICCKLVTESEELTKKQKEFLEQYVLSTVSVSFPYVRVNMEKEAVRPKQFLFLKWGEKFDPKRCKTRYDEEIKKTLTKGNVKTLDTNKELFTKWTKDLITGLEVKICSFNSSLASSSKELEKYNKEIHVLESQRRFMMGSKMKIEDLLDFKEVVGDE